MWDGWRTHAQLIYPHCKQQYRRIWITCHLAAHAAPFAMIMRSLYRVLDKPEHGRVEMIVELCDIGVAAVNG